MSRTSGFPMRSRAATDHLLRTLAAVPPEARVLCVAPGEPSQIDALARLGFDLWACLPDRGGVREARSVWQGASGGEAAEAERRIVRASPAALGYPDAFADWVVLGPDASDTRETLREAARVLRPGGWVWLWTRQTFARDLHSWAESAGLAVAEAPSDVAGGGLVAIYRRAGGAVA